MLGDDDLCREMKLPGAAVVAKALPKPQHAIFASAGQVGDCRQRRDKSVEIWLDRGDGRLLQHDLAYPHPIRIAIAPPRQIAGMPAVPGQQPASELRAPVAGRPGLRVRALQ